MTFEEAVESHWCDVRARGQSAEHHCEEFTSAPLIDQARMAEQAGFRALAISDHFHPWNDEQGQSPFVWSMIGVCRR